MKTKEEKLKEAVYTFESAMKEIGVSFFASAIMDSEDKDQVLHVCAAGGNEKNCSFAIYKGMRAAKLIENSVNYACFKFYDDQKNSHAGN